MIGSGIGTGLISTIFFISLFRLYFYYFSDGGAFSFSDYSSIIYLESLTGDDLDDLADFSVRSDLGRELSDLCDSRDSGRSSSSLI